MHKSFFNILDLAFVIFREYGNNINPENTGDEIINNSIEAETTVSSIFLTIESLFS
jgi:hypothetical protein